MIRTIRTRKIVFHTASISLAVLLIWLSLRGINFAEFWESMRVGNYFWIAPLLFITLISHLIRAVRWHALVSAIDDEASSKIPILHLFAALMIGNMVNYVLPRAGEIARCTYLSANHKASFSSLLGTVTVERILDIVVLGLGLLITVSFLRERFQVISDELSIPDLPWLLIAIGCLLIAIVIYTWLRLKPSSGMRIHLISWLKKFIVGLKTIYQTHLRSRIIWTTIIMWFLYALMAYIPLLMFKLGGSGMLSYWDAMAIMFIGVLGIAVPTPGGAGSFHYLTILTLTALYGIEQSGATAYAVFVHGAQFVLYLSVGGLILLVSWFKSGRKPSESSEP